MNEQERRRAIQMRLTRARLGSGPRPPIPCGLEPLDGALGGGFPRGRIVELFGPPSSGKTALALQTVAHAQRAGLAAAWIDADRAFHPSAAAALGVSLERLALALPESAEEALEMARRLVASGALDLVVVDSAAALAPWVELTAPVGESGPGLQARVLASGFRRLAAAAARAGAVALVTNQTRGHPSREDEETTAGGPALRLYAAVRLALIPGDQARVRFRVLKNKASMAFREGQLARSPQGGFSASP